MESLLTTDFSRHSGTMGSGTRVVLSIYDYALVALCITSSLSIINYMKKWSANTRLT